MAGFDNDCCFADNADFSTAGAGGGSATNGLQTNGQFWIGTTAVNAGGTHINVGSITSPNGTLTIGYSSPNITIDAVGGTTAVDSFTMQTGTSPVLPNAAGLVTFNGSSVAAGTNPVRTNGTGVNTMQLEVQISQALAAADATKIGLSNFDSTSFAVAATGFVTLSTTGAGKTITGDSGGALSPTANNWNILGGPGVTTTGSGSTLTINSVVYTDQPASIAIVSDSGSFATNGAGIILDLPAAPTQGELIEVVCTTANAVAIDAPAGDFIRAGTLITSSGGTLTSTAIGDAVVMRFNTANQTWYCTSLIGTWLVA